jgi:hypothetical protein
MISLLANTRLMCVMAVLVAFPIVCHSADVVSPESVIDNWKQREQALETVCLSWRQSIFQKSAGPTAALKSAELGVPEVGRTADVEPVSLIVRGAKYRYQTFGFRNAKDAVARAPYITAFDGTTRYTLFEQAVAMGTNGSAVMEAIGTIDKVPTTHIANKGSLLAVNLVFRPFGSGLLSDKPPPRLDERTVDIAGRPCIFLTFADADPARRLRVLADKQSLTPLGMEVERGGVREAVVEVKYADVSLPHTVTEWEYTLFSNRAVMESASATKVAIATDCDPPASTFVIRYPEGARVVDKREGKETRLRAKVDGELVPRD